MSYLFDATTERLNATFLKAIPQDGDATIIVIIRADDWDGNGQGICMLSPNSLSNRGAMGIHVSSTADAVQGWERNNAFTGDWVTEGFGGTADDVWVLLAFTARGDGNLRTIFEKNFQQLDRRTNFVARDTGPFDEFMIGNTNTGSLGWNSTVKCRIAEVAIWDIILPDVDIESLHLGMGKNHFRAPNTVRPDRLHAYWTLRNDDQGLINQVHGVGGDLSVTGATADADHPNIVPVKSRISPIDILNVQSSDVPVLVQSEHVRSTRYFDAASSQSLDYLFAPITAAPFTMSCMFYDDASAADDRCMIQIQDDGTSGNYFRLCLGDDETPTVLPVAMFTSGLNGNSTDNDHRAASTTNRELARWHHACGIIASATDRRAFLDGKSKGTSTTSADAPANLDSISIGYEGDSTSGDYWSGGLLWPAVWDIALSDTEVLMLASGVPPWKVRPEHLVFCAPLDGRRDDLRDIVTGTLPTVNGGGIRFTQAPKNLSELPFVGMFSGTVPDLAIIQKPW